MRVKCRRCGATMIKDGYYYACPTCRDLPLKSAETLRDPQDWKEETENRIDFELALNRLKPREKRIATLSKEGYSQREITEKQNLSSGRVSQIIKEISKNFV